MSAPEILNRVRSRVQSITGRYGFSGQMLGELGSGRLITGVGGGRVATEVRKRANTVRNMIPLRGLGLLGEITDNGNVRDMAIESFPASNAEGRALTRYPDAAVYVE